jgi:AGZA family xanthine/uracil permease-like MFS transporter
MPIGLAALLVGTAIGWIGGYMSVPDVTSAAKDIAIGLPTLHGHMLIEGLKNVGPLLATAIPLGVYNFTEGMTNVESASVAGDSYNLRSVLFADGTGAIIGAALGSPFPPAVYIGHPGWKAAGGRSGYSMAVGIVIAALCFLGMFGLLGALLPLPAIVPILLYIGLLIGAQAFQSVPRLHAAAVVIALIPNIASWAQGLMSDALSAAGTTPEAVGYDNLGQAGVVYHGLLILGSGAVLAGLVLGAIVSFLIDRRFIWAAGYAFGGAVLSFVGLIHAPKVGWDANGQVALGYALTGVLCLAYALRREEPIDRSAELALLDAEAGHAEVPTQERSPAAQPTSITLPETAGAGTA